MFELNPEFVEKLNISTHILGFASYFHPSFASLYPELAKKELKISFNTYKASNSEIKKIITKNFMLF